MSPRVKRARTAVALVTLLGTLATVPWLGWQILVPFVLASLNLATVEWRIARSSRPEWVVARSSLVTATLIGVMVAVSGGPKSPLLPWLATPVALVAARFGLRVLLAGVGVTAIIMLAATFPVDPQGFVDDPTLVIASLVLVLNVVLVSSALLGSDLQHRGEAAIDHLTGALSRKSLEIRFAELEQQAQMSDAVVSLITFDIDDFKRVNDAHGHDRGDDVIRATAHEVRKQLRSFELMYRVGGEEFIVLLPRADMPQAAEIAERLRSGIESSAPCGLPVTISLGVSSARGGDVQWTEMFKAADVALYEAKRQGKNRVVVAPPGWRQAGGPEPTTPPPPTAS